MTRRLWTGVAVALVLALWYGSTRLQADVLAQRKLWPVVDEYVMLPSPRAAPLLSMGYRELYADLTWIRGLVYYGSNLTGENELQYLRQFIDNVIAVDPRFERIYSWAADAVTYRSERATQDEFHESIHYLELGMKVFPERYENFWRAGIRYYVDLWDEDPAVRRGYRERGAALIEQAMHKDNAPGQLATLAASLRSKLGQKEVALRNLREMIMTTENKKAREKMLERFRGLAGSQEIAREIGEAAEAFRARWQAAMPYVPPSLFVLLGERPDPAIDFRRLATERDLFGAVSDDE